jgi:hypothetical protein
MAVLRQELVELGDLPLLGHLAHLRLLARLELRFGCASAIWMAPW